MKKTMIYKGLLVITLGLSLLACQQAETDVLSEPESDGATLFYAELEQVCDPADTRVYVQDRRIFWHADDRISIFNKKTTNVQYSFTGETGDTSGSFTQVPGDAGTGSRLSAVYAVYPYSESTSINTSSVMEIDLPAMQEYAEHSFGRNANTMVSVTTDQNLLFKNLGGYLVVKLYGADVSVTGLKLKGNGGEKIAGAAAVTAVKDAAPSVEMGEKATESVTLTCEKAVALGATAEAYTEFWFVLPPTTFEKGFTLTGTTADGLAFEKSTDKPVTIARNGVTRMSPFEVEPTVPVLDLASIRELEDGSAATCKDVVVAAASKWGALVVDETGAYMYLTGADENTAVRGDRVSFTGVRYTYENTEEQVVWLSDLVVTASGQPVPDMEWKSIIFAELGSVNTGSSGTLRYQEEGSLYYVYSPAIGYVVIEHPIDIDLSGYVGKTVTVEGYTNGVENETTYRFLLNSIREITFELNPNWKLSYEGNDGVSDSIVNLVSGGSDRFALYALLAYKAENITEAGSIEALAAFECTRAAAYTQYYMTYYGMTIADLTNVDSAEMSFTQADRVGDFIAFVVGLDEKGYPSGKYAYVEYSREDHTVAATYEDFIGEWYLGSSKVDISEEVYGESYTVTGFRGQDEAWPVTALYQDGALVFSEQVVQGNVSDGVIFEGLFTADSNIYLSYPFNSDAPDVLFTVYKQDDGTCLVVGGGNTKYDYPFDYFSFITVASGNMTDYTDLVAIPTSMRPYVPDTGEYLYKETFEDEATLSDWTFIDADGDGNDWFFMDESCTPYSGVGVLSSASYNSTSGALKPDNWASTPAINFTTGNYLSFWVGAQDPKWAGEHFAVYIGSEPGDDDIKLVEATLMEGNPAETVVVDSDGRTYERYIIPIPDKYAGKTGYISFRHFNCTDMFRINLDDVAVTEYEPQVSSAPAAAPAKSPMAAPAVTRSLGQLPQAGAAKPVLVELPLRSGLSRR